VKEILEDAAAQKLSAHSSNFWVLVNAVKKVYLLCVSLSSG